MSSSSRQTTNGGFHFATPDLERQGFVVPQAIYVPPSLPRGFTPQPPISFHDAITGLKGIPLDKALRQDISGLSDWNARPATGQGGHKIGLRILWPGYDTWTDHINVTESGANGGQYITKIKLANEVAKKIRDFHRDMSHAQSKYSDQSWWINRIPLNQLVLLEIRHVSPGSWQPVIIWRV